jgi:mannose-1-phosphate guanylyltransferase
LLHILIMAGGKGERFWPKSRRAKPKQFLEIAGDGTMLQQTARRVCGLVDFDRIHVVAGAEYAPLVQEQLPELSAANFIIEPEGKNTAPCIGLAARFIEKSDPQAVIAVLAADHLIHDEAGFCGLLAQAAKLAEVSDGVVTLGIRPDRSETGYGYIQVGEVLPEFPGAFRVARFTEKPDAATAVSFVTSGEYLWNSGIFIWQAATIRRLIAEFLPELHHGLERIMITMGTPDYEAVLRREFAQLPSISVDYGILERAPEVYVIPAAIGWDDVGGWNALERAGAKDEAGNVLRGGEFALLETQGCIFDTTGKKLVAALGVRDLIFVETDDAILICPKDKAQEMKALIEKLKAEGKEKYL